MLLIVTLLLAGALVPLASQIEQKRISDTQKVVDDAKEALLGFSVANRRLPCPDKTSGATNGVNDTPNDGIEDYNTSGANNGRCITKEGNLPWSTLGTVSGDAWGRPLHYRVTQSFSDQPPLSTFSLSSSGDIRICAMAACAAPANLPAVILSYGKNGGETLTCPNAARADECENQNSDTTFVSRTITQAGTTAGEFDDQVVWISANVLFNRMVVAGRLP